VVVWAMFCWVTLDPAIHLDIQQRCGNLTPSTCLNIVKDQVHPFMTKVFPGGSGVFQQDNAPCQTAHVVHEWFKEHDFNPIKHLWDVLDLDQQD